MVFSIGSLCAQESQSKKEKKYQRYENGELVENKYYLERDGQAIKGTDFEMPKMDIKMSEMESRMKDMQKKMDLKMKSSLLDMDSRIEGMMQRCDKMQQDMRNRMNRTMKGKTIPKVKYS